MKTIWIHLISDKILLLPSAITKDGVCEVSYLPVLTSNISTLTLTTFEEMLFKTINNSMQVVDLGNFPENKEHYDKYVAEMMQHLGEKSFASFYKKSSSFLIEIDKKEALDIIKITPCTYIKGANHPIQESVYEIETSNINKREIATKILSFMSDFAKK